MEYVIRKCKVCDKLFQIKAFRIAHGRGIVCSIPCRIKWQKKFVTGEKCHLWKGGFYISHTGYRYIKSPNHPFKNGIGYVVEHRLVVEKHIGRYLKRSEFVHHKNGNKLDNRIENLQIVNGQKEHGEEHRRKSTCCDRKHYGHGFCIIHYHKDWWIKRGKFLKLARQTSGI